MLLFVDFEASSLSKQSYPIEVGWVWEDGREEGHLIRPAPGWVEWDDSAQAIHGISRGLLARDGEPHDRVCDRVIAAFEGNDVYASAPSWDGHWLSMLLRAAGQPRHLLRLRSSEEAFMAKARQDGASETLATARVAAARALVGQAPAAHRAIADARREWETWRAV